MGQNLELLVGQCPGDFSDPEDMPFIVARLDVPQDYELYGLISQATDELGVNCWETLENFSDEYDDYHGGIYHWSLVRSLLGAEILAHIESRGCPRTRAVWAYLRELHPDTPFAQRRT